MSKGARTRQPPGTTFVGLDPQNPLAQGIVSGIDARGWSLVGKAVTRVSTPSVAPRPGGVALLGNNATLLSEQFASGPIDYPFTMVFVMSNVTRTANPNPLAGLGNTGGDQICSIQFQTTQNNRFIYRNVNAGTTLIREFSANAASSNTGPVVVSVTVTSASVANVYWNGVLDNGALSSNTANAPAFDRFAIGGIDRGTDVFADTGNNILLGFVTSKGWKAQDHFNYAKNPWQIFRPRRAPVGKLAGTVTHTTTGDVTGAGATVAGSATHLTLHTTSGAVQGGGATAAGAALHPHTTTGAATGGGATVAGAADVTTGGTSHSSSGATEGGGATVAGAATHLTLHATSGATEGGGAAVAGASGHLTLHETSGAVQGGGGTTTGTAELTSLNGGKSSYLRQWLMEYYEAEWAQKVPVLVDPPAVAPTPVAQAARAITRRTVRAAVAEQKKPSPAPYRADPRAAVHEFIQRQTAAVARKARTAAQADTQDLAALTRRQQQRSAEAEEAEDEGILLLAAVL